MLPYFQQYVNMLPSVHAVLNCQKVGTDIAIVIINITKTKGDSL